MKFYFLVSTFVVGFAMTAAAVDDDSDFVRLQGSWRGTSPDGAMMSTVIDGNTLKSTVKLRSNVRGRGGSYLVEQDFTIDEIGEPKEIDFHTKDENGDPKIVLAIYKLRGDKFTICMDPTGKRRPTKFDGSNEGGSMLIYNRYPQTGKSTKAESASKVTGKKVESSGKITVNSNTR